MYYKILLVFLLLIVPHVTDAKDISVFSSEAESKNFDFTLNPGAWEQRYIVVKNEGKKELELDLDIGDKQNKDLLNFIFITKEVPEKYKGELKSKNDNIRNLCDEYSSDTDLSKWCAGEAHPKITLKPKSQKIIQFLVRLSKDSKDTIERNLSINAVEISSENDKNNEKSYSEKTSIILKLKPKLEREINLKIKNLFLEKDLGVFDVLKWAKQNFKETYNVHVTVKNDSKNQEKDAIPFEVQLITHSVKSGEEEMLSKKDKIKQGSTKEINFENVKVPWFGSTTLTTKIVYRDGDKDKSHETSPVRIFIFPIREAVGVFALLVIILFFWLFRKEKGNLVGNEKKHKKTKDSTESRDEYENQEMADNACSIKEKYQNTHTFEENHDFENFGEIDIEWLKDEEKYEESLKKQAKKINRNILIIFFVIAILVVSVLFIISSNKEPKKLNLKDENTSIDDLIEQKQNDKSGILKKDDENNNDNENQKNDLEKEVLESIDNSEISIQVLNAGALKGQAGETTDKLKKEGYRVNDATNAKQNIEDLVVYYSKDTKNKAEQVLKSVLKFFEGYDGKLEESNKISKEYDADVVIILGKKQEKISKNVNSSKNSGSIQILDGGGAHKNIEEITKLLESKFELKSVEKSKNTYKTTTIYFAKGKDTQADKIHKVIEKTVGKVVKEEANELVKKYNSDVVIVVSK